MQKRILPLAITAITLISFIGWSCTKLDTTDIGSDLLTVDNVHTFDTILDINSTQGLFSNDSTFVGKSEDFVVGNISNDPLFGTTAANIYMQLKPTFYPFYLGNAGDTLKGLDSVVLCLKYSGFWGDSTLPVHLEVHEIVDYDFKDSVYKMNPTSYKPNISSTILASTDVNVLHLADTIHYANGRDYSLNQIRIKLPVSWANLLYSRDSIASSSGNNAFYSDSTYRFFYHGLAIIAGTSGQGLLYTNLADTSTKIEIHYRKKNILGVTDSVYSSLRLNANSDPTQGIGVVSNTSNYILRNRGGYPISNPLATEHYLQTAPGTYVNMSIPGLAGLSNRIIHRAEIIVEQIPTPADPMSNILTAPNFLYIDLKDTGSNNNYKPIYYDLNTQQQYDPDYKTGAIQYIANPIDYQYFGGFKRTKNDPITGLLMNYYNFNISRYVQHIVTDHIPAYNMRLYAPFSISYLQYSNAYIPYSNNLAYGRIRIGSGSNPNYKLRLRIIYSKL